MRSIELRLGAALAAILLTPLASPQRLLADLAPGRDHARPSAFTPLGALVLFVASTPADGTEVWRTDGSVAGTYPLSLVPGPGSGLVRVELAALGEVAVFFGTDGVRSGLFATDGSQAGTRFLAALPVGGQAPTTLSRIAAQGGKGYFLAANPALQTALYRTDGTPAGSVALHTLPGTPGQGPLATSAGVVFGIYAANQELWSCDGTAAGTQRIASWPASWPERMTQVGGRVFFREESQALTTPLWVTDGTAAGTFAVPGFPAAWIASIADRAGLAMVLASPVDGAVDLWQSDGTVGGTTRVTRLVPSPGSTFPSVSPGYLVGAADLVFVKLGGHPVFATLWRSDGTAAGTFEFSPLGYLLRIYWGLTPVGNRVLYGAQFGPEGVEPWVTDGTPGGTRLLADVAPGAASSAPMWFTLAPGLATGPAILFSADDQVHGIEPWIVPAGTAGAAALAAVYPGCAAAGPVPALDRDGGSPRLGNSAFALRLRTAHPLAPVALLLARVPGARVQGCATLLPADLLLSSVTDGSGAARFGFPIPADPSLLGARLFAQPAAVVAGGFLLGVVDLGAVAALVVGA